jgi:CHASE3 domain sensor protein
MPLNFTRLLISFSAAILAFLATGIITYRAIETLVTNQQRQVVARLIAIELQTLLYLTVMAETGQRGFVITGREAYLQPYDEAARRLPESIAFLRKNLAGDPAQLQRLAEIERLQKLKFAELDESIQASSTWTAYVPNWPRWSRSRAQDWKGRLLHGGIPGRGHART